MEKVRQKAILSLLNEKHFLTVGEMCQTLYASGATIRRDLSELEAQGLLKRVRGGAIAYDGISSDLPSLLRSNSNVEAKKHIAQLASALYMRDSMTLFMDSSTTIKCLAQEITHHKQLSIITNSVEISYLLSTASSARIYSSGGRVRNNSTMVGPSALSMVKSRYADVFFFSCAGFSTKYGTTETNEENVEIKKAMFANSKMRVLLCDSSKFDKVFSYRCFEIEEIDAIVTEKKPTTEILEGLPKSVKLHF